MREYADSKEFRRQRNLWEFFTMFLLKQLVPAIFFSFILTLGLLIFINAIGSVLINVISPDLLTALIIMIVMPAIIVFYFVVREIRMRRLKQHIGELEDVKIDFSSKIED